MIVNDLFTTQNRNFPIYSLHFLVTICSIDALVTNVSSTTPVLGKLIRTSCGIDEVCLSDIIPEVAETYPDKQLEIILRTTEPPQATILAGLIPL